MTQLAEGPPCPLLAIIDSVQKGTSCLGQRTDDEGNRFGNVGSAEQGVPSWGFLSPYFYVKYS